MDNNKKDTISDYKYITKIDSIEKITPKNLHEQTDVIVPDKIPDDIFILIDEDNLEKAICEEIIKSFEKDLRREKGIFGGGQIDQRVKNTTDLVLSGFSEKIWRQFDNYLFDSLKVGLKKYLNVIYNANGNLPNNLFDKTGFQIQKYEKNIGKYIWHSDNFTEKNNDRFLTFIWYLNDVIEGGETCFLNGKIKPTAGKLLIFPSTWTYIHKGNVPISEDKYIITGWLSIPIN
jgi:hypothetical protein